MRVIVIGGGVAGMSVAHELAERDGFDVVVYELRNRPGGKARSIPASEPTGEREPLPGEHGFRVFFGFYQHVIEAMERIPAANGGTVRDLLEDTRRVGMARYDGDMLVNVAGKPRDPEDWKQALEFALEYARDLKFEFSDIEHFIGVMNGIAAAGSKRKVHELERQTWWEYSGAKDRSAAYQKFLADGLSRSLAATRAEHLSARSGGNTLVQLFQDLTRDAAARVLPGPTNDLWLDPWLAHLRARGVDYRMNHKVEEVDVRGGRVHGIRGHQVTWPGGAVDEAKPFDDTADFYVLAVPVEVVQHGMELGELKDESYGVFPQIHEVEYRWMNGVLYYLNEEFPTVPGHIIHIDSPWALTSINQPQFWSGVDLSSYGDGSVRDIISICVSEWNEPGMFAAKGKQAKDCSKEEIRDEVFQQLAEGFRRDGRDLRWDMVVDWYLDEDITWPNPTDTANAEPLMINKPKTLESRPFAELPAVENLFLASDYVRTGTDVATMEAANEAARHAVNALLEAAGSDEDACPTWPLREPGGIFAKAREADDDTYDPGEDRAPAPPTVVEAVDGELVWHEDVRPPGT